MDKESSPDPPEPDVKPSGFSSFWAELRRRHVVRVAMVYLVVGWLVIQVANATFSDFGIPVWAYRFVVLMVVLGFPISVVVAWAFELTPQGIKTTKVAKEQKSEEPASSAFRQKRQWFTVLFAAGLPTLIFGALAVYFYATRSDSSPPVSPDVSVGGSPHQVEDLVKSIAVLPLENMSPDPENAFFADGVHEDILTNLSKIRDLFVIGRTSTLQYRDTEKTLQQIGSELGVRYLLEGSVRRAGNQVKITVQLIDSQSGGHVWAEDYNRNLDDIFAIQAEVAQAIGAALHAAISPEQLASLERVPTDNLEAYDYYVRSHDLLSVEQLPMKLEYASRAVELDPDFAQAYAAVAFYHLLSAVNNRVPPEEGFPQVMEWARKASAINDSLFDAKLCAFYVKLFYEWDWKGTESLLDELIVLGPNNSYAFEAQCHYYSIIGAGEEAVRAIKRGIELDPINPELKRVLGQSYYLQGNFEEAIRVLQEALPNDPSHSEILRRIGRSQTQLGEYQSAIKTLQRVVVLQGGKGWSRMNLAVAYALSGQEDKAREELIEIQESMKGEYVPPIFFVGVHAALGEIDEAFRWLDRSFENRDFWLVGLKHDPEYAPLLTDPRIQPYLDQLNYP